MEASVVGAVVGASIQVLLQNLLTLSLEQISLVRDFKNDLEMLKKSFFMVQDFLHDAEMRQVTDIAVKRWLRELEALAFEADNILDEINYQLLSKKVNDQTTKNQKMKKVVSFFSSSNNKDLGRKIRKVNKELETINLQARDYGLQTRIGSTKAPVSGSDASGSMETDSFSVDPIFLGRENDVSRIVEMLITTHPAGQKVSVLPIVGMGGLGKTTLARKVFNDEKIISHFGDNRVWMYVSRDFDVRNIFKNILTSLTRENFELGTNEALLKKLQDSLGAKRYLFVLDDHWNVDQGKWDSFVNSLLGISSTTGNALIVTTRSQEVSSVVKTLPIHELEILSEDDCWSIIKAKAFREGDDSLEFEKMGRNVAKRCKGLPLAAKVVGGLFYGKSKDEWLSIENNWLSDFGDGDSILKILKISFDNLWSPSLKKCFAYCSVFPKGCEIRKDQLVELWMAEGFLQTSHQRSNINMEITGTRNFNLLLHNSLLQVVRRDGYGNVTHCNMHDLVHDLACFVLCEDDNIKTGNYSQSRYIGYKSSGDELLSMTKEQKTYVRTLFSNDKVYDIRFSNFKSLHTLTLDGKDIIKLPTSVKDLRHLRYLDTSGTRIRYLPDSICELYHLQTLRADKKLTIKPSELKRLPNSLSYLISLRHIHISFNTTLPPEIGRLTSLQTLPYFHVGDGKGCGVSELRNLRDLKGKLEIRNLENVHDKNEAMSADLLGKPGIYELKLLWKLSREGEVNDESVLEGLQPHPNLKSLDIWGFNGKHLPLWTSKMAVQVDGRYEGLNNLMEIKLQHCSECEELPMLGHLPHLKYLYLNDLINVKSIRSSFYGIDSCSKSTNISSKEVSKRDTIVVFRALERLVLFDMPNLIEWAEVYLPLPSEGDQTQQTEVVVFPCLETLSVEKCRQLVRAPSHFPRLKELEIREMNSGLPLENICGMNLTSLTHLHIVGIEGLKCLPNWLFSNNQNLSELHLSNCQNMNRGSLSFSVNSAHHVEAGSRSISSLQHLKMGPFIDSSWNNVSFNETVDAILQASQFTLRHLSLTGMRLWVCLPDQLQHLTSLEYLRLFDFGIEALPEWFGNLSSLQHLSLWNCKRLRHLPSKEAMQRLTKLNFVRIMNCPLLLKERNNNQIVDSQWPKISHIPNVLVYEHQTSSGHLDTGKRVHEGARIYLRPYEQLPAESSR